MSAFEEEKLPSSFLHEVVSKSQDTIVSRSNVRNLEEHGKWVIEITKGSKCLPGRQTYLLGIPAGSAPSKKWKHSLGLNIKLNQPNAKRH
ncbi:hypothetical protein AVEN_161504-1 [Araneus ventricosus]|uniref:Uncharacterized protein n=1 Tax=Araneus ventricosus TaxID=182803 RepID=A0A4Y2WP82_ARAVE|nr:hypothetical protein AVEN_161504-1 [Araneus ventricosus]